MDKSALLETIVDSFTDNMKRFQSKSGAIHCQFFPTYKGTEDIEHLVSMQASLEYQSYIVAFRFTVHKNLMEVNNILDCFVCFNKQRELYYPLEYVLDYLNHNTLIPLVIPCISNALTMTQCFEILSHEVTKIFEDIENISFNKIQQNELEMIVKKEIYEKEIPKDLDDEDYQFIHNYYIENIILSYFLEKGYIYFLLGDYKASLKKYAKRKKKTHYENIIIELMKKSPPQKCLLPYTVQYQLEHRYKLNKPQLNKKEIIVYIVSMFVYSCIWIIIYYAISMMISHYIQNRTLYFIANHDDIMFSCFFASWAPAFMLSYLTREKVYSRLFKKDYNNYKESQLVAESPREFSFMKKFFIVTIFLGFSFPCIELLNYVSFYDDGFVDNTISFSLKGHYYHYNEIEKVFRQENEDNIFGDKIEPSIIIKMKDGEIIDLWEFDQDEYIEKEIMPFLKLKNVKIEEKKK